MKKNITPTKITRLWGKMGTRASLAAHLSISEASVRGWESGNTDINKSGYRFEVERLLVEHGIS